MNRHLIYPQQSQQKPADVEIIQMRWNKIYNFNKNIKPHIDLLVMTTTTTRFTIIFIIPMHQTTCWKQISDDNPVTNSDDTCIKNKHKIIPSDVDINHIILYGSRSHTGFKKWPQTLWSSNKKPPGQLERRF